MGKRSAAVAATRRRIVEATLELHDRQGIQATSWEQIAERAGVGIATVYRHFPTLEELVPACGVVTFELLALPEDEGIRAAFDGLDGVDRLRRLVDELFAVYARGAGAIENCRRERHALPHLLDDAYEEIERACDELVREALAPFDGDTATHAAVRGLTDVRVWRSLADRGLSADETASVATRALAGLVGLR